MAWDSKTARRRTNSRSLSLHIRQQSRAAAFSQTSQPKSPHVSDPFLQAFLNPSFSAADYLNATLPPLQTPAGAASSRSEGGGQAPVPLADLSARAQTTLSQLNAHTTRLTNTLTQLTDEILRSGSRLAYEVELLRGETLSLAETLSDGLQDDISKFVPEGRDSSAQKTEGQEIAGNRGASAVLMPPEPAAKDGTKDATPAAAAAAVVAAPAAPNEPPYIAQLRTLTLVRSRLDSVIKTFGDAMESVFPPSELSVSSSFLSVSAPDPGAEAHSTEEKGQQVLQRLRDEITALLSDAVDPIRGVEDAARRIEELKELSTVWKGTAEERGRAKFIEGLAKTVEDRHRELVREMEQASGASRREGGGGSGRQDAERRGPGGVAEPGVAENRGYAGGYGLMSQLQRIRGGL